MTDPAGSPPAGSSPPGGAAPPGPGGPGERKPSGLANPERAARSLGAAAMTLEGVTLLLAIQPIRILTSGDTTAAVVFLVVTAVAAFVLAGLMKRPWAWRAAGLLQIVLLFGFFAHWSIAVIGVLFGLAWLYVLKVRRTILS